MFLIFFINVIICLILKPENVKLALSWDNLTLYSNIWEKNSSTLQVHDIVIVILKYQSNLYVSSNL